jgi:hypothetical protein
MSQSNISTDGILDGFFCFFGFAANPATEKVKTIMAESPAEKIRADIKRINKSYRDKYLELRKDLLCLGK